MSRQISPLRRLTQRQTRQSMEALQRAAEHCESWRGLSRKVSEATGERLDDSAAYNWYTRGCPGERAVDIEHATQGAVLRQEIRPDLYEGMRLNQWLMDDADTA